MGGGGEDDGVHYHRSPSDLNNNILLTAIISLSIVLVLVIALHLYARCIIRRQARRRAAAIEQLSLTVAHAHHYREPPNAGLDPTAIASLPMFVFKRTEPKKRDEDDATIMECAVCLSALEDDEMARLLPNCKHVFHLSCIDTWLSSHSTCPVCRTRVEPRLEPEPREGPAGVDHGGAAGGPTAPLLEAIEGTSDDASLNSPKINGSLSRLSSLRRILGRERSSRRIQPPISSQEDIVYLDLERQ